MMNQYIIVYERGFDDVYAVSENFGYVCPIPSSSTKRFSSLEGAKAQALLLASVDPTRFDIHVRDAVTGKKVFDASAQALLTASRKFFDALTELSPQMTEVEANLFRLAHTLFEQKDYPTSSAVLDSLTELLDIRLGIPAALEQEWAMAGM